MLAQGIMNHQRFQTHIVWYRGTGRLGNEHQLIGSCHRLNQAYFKLMFRRIKTPAAYVWSTNGSDRLTTGDAQLERINLTLRDLESHRMEDLEQPRG